MKILTCGILILNMNISIRKQHLKVKTKIRIYLQTGEFLKEPVGYAKTWMNIKYLMKCTQIWMFDIICI